MSDAVSQRLDDLGDALTNTLTVVQDLRLATNFQTELLLKVLKAVTKEATGDLGELLKAIVAVNHDHGRKLDELLAIARR
jgi:hypothetical protein